MKVKLGKIFMIMGSLLVVGAVGLYLFNVYDARRAESQSEKILQSISEIDLTERDYEKGDDYHIDPTMTEKEIDGQKYIGYLSIPALSLKLPILSDWSMSKLKIAPCRYYGSVKTDDMVLCAHNYRSHFGYLSKLSPGDKVAFTDMDGVKHKYVVAAQDLLMPADIEEMTDAGYDLTLFTCTYGGRSRITIRLNREEKK